jgi:peptide/nickel transport system permease protein
VARFLIRRVLQGLLVLLLMTVTVYVIFFLGPGPQSVARVMAGKSATPAQVNAIATQFYLNKPWYVSYGHFVFRLLHGDLGFDYYNSVPVTTSLKQAFPITLSLLLGASIIWLLIGLATGILSAVRTRSVLDRVFTTQALFFYSMPTFVLGLLFILYLYQVPTSHGVAIFPAPNGQPSGFASNPLTWAHDYILPWLTLALVSAATYTRLTRGSMLDVFGEDYIRTARSKGMSERRLVLRHNLRASLTPVVTQFGLDVGTLIGGALITEQVFGLPGLGWTAVHAIQEQDLPVIMGITIVASAGIIVANLLVDIFYAVLDPRVRLH